MRQICSKDSAVFSQGRADGDQSQGQEPNASLRGQDPGPDSPPNPVQRRKARQPTGANPCRLVALLERRGVDHFQSSGGTTGANSNSNPGPGYWGFNQIRAALGISSDAMAVWSRKWGYPTIRRWNRITGRWNQWCDDSMLLAWKLKMAELDRVRRYGPKKRKGERALSTGCTR